MNYNLNLIFAAIIRHMTTLSMPATMPTKKDDDVSRVFAQNFKQAREDSGLTQDQVAQAMGWTQPYVSDIEKMKETVNLKIAQRLADVVKQPLWKLLIPPKK
jgi:DNA-binding XRE family transcriptional regulator